MLLLKKITKILFTALAILSIVLYCFKHPNVVSHVANYNWYFLAVIVGLYCVFYVLNAFVLLYLIKPYNKSVKFFKVLGINQLSSFVNNLLPFRVVSVGVKALLLKKIFGVTPGTTIGTFALSTLIFLITCLFSLFFSVIFLSIPKEVFNSQFDGNLAFFTAITLVVCFLIIDNRYQPLNNINFPKFILDFKSSLLSVSKQTILILACLYIAQIILASYMVYLLFLGTDNSVSFLICLFMTSIGNLTGILSLTPGNIGIKEVSYAGAGVIFGVPADITVAVLLIDRCLQMFLLTIGLPFFSYLKDEAR